MKILYGIQATGNGHITRARSLAPMLEAHGWQVDYLFSGRAPEKLFNMEAFGNYQVRTGLTFVTDRGKVKIFRTATENKPLQFLKDIRELDTHPYDLVLSDFEPVTAWAARRQGTPSMSISHQSAFKYNIPQPSAHTPNNLFAGFMLNYFAPTDYHLGLHWHHFDQPLLPPLFKAQSRSDNPLENKIVVYMGFEKVTDIIAWLQPFSDYTFHIYAAVDQAEQLGHIHIHPLCYEGFHRDLADCCGVISNAGFELASECLHLGVKLLVKPLAGQLEQLANGMALQAMGRGDSIMHLDPQQLATWLAKPQDKPIHYPDSAPRIAAWISDGVWHNSHHLAQSLWEQTENLPKALAR